MAGNSSWASTTHEIAAAVVERAKQGDGEAFAEVIRHCDPGLRALAFRLLGDRDRMEDALQEAYVKAFRALPRFRGNSKLGTWLYRIVYNACLDELERSRRVIHLPLAEVADPPETRASVAETVANRRELAEALSALPPEDRAAVLLVDAQGFDYREAGAVLGVPEGTIASRLNRARAALRRALDERPEVAAES
jgi:RNA polymerase sigma-70 factor, ECF subfamily